MILDLILTILTGKKIGEEISGLTGLYDMGRERFQILYLART